METPQVSRWLTHSYVGVPTVAGAFVLGLLLLFFQDLDPDLRTRLVPALVVFVLGLSLLAFVYFALDARNVARCKAETRPKTPGPQPRGVFIAYIGIQAVWLIVLVAYLIWKGVL